MVKYHFRLAGVPPEKADVEIDIDPDMTVAEVKELVRKKYGLNAVLDIHLIWNAGENSSE